MKTLPPDKDVNARILFVSNSCWSIYNFRLEVIRHFIRRGYEVHVIATKDDFAILLMNVGCRVHDFAFNNRALSPVADLKIYFRLKHLYRKIKPSLIFHYVIKPNIYGSLAAASLNIPSVAVVTGLGYAFSRQNWLSALVSKLYQHSLKKVHKVWFLNREDAEMFSSRKIADPAKMDILNSEGINTAHFQKKQQQHGRDENTFVFLMVTRMLWTKGIGVLAEASRILHEKGLRFECHIIGFFEQHHPNSISIEQLQQWQESKVFNYIGFTHNVVPYLERADCFVLPSYYQEGVPRSLLEACSMELPVITTDNTGCRDVVVEGENGFLCNKNDPADLAVKMEKILLMDPYRRCEMGRKGRELVAGKFEMRFILQKYDQLVSSLLPGKKAGTAEPMLSNPSA